MPIEVNEVRTQVTHSKRQGNFEMKHQKEVI